MRLHRCRFLAIRVFLLRLLRPLGGPRDALLLLLGQLLTLLAAQRHRIVGLIPLAERNRIDGDYGAFDKGLSTDQLVVGRIVDGVDDARLAGGTLKWMVNTVEYCGWFCIYLLDQYSSIYL
jgi:hypothetical protein